MPAAAPMSLTNGDLLLDATSTLQKLRVSESFDFDEECGVIGVLLSDDRRTAESEKCSPRLILGSIVVSDASVRRRTCSDLRQILHTQFPTLNGNFMFLSKDGWPIHRQQETSVRGFQVINQRNAIEIQRNFGNDKCRVAVVKQPPLTVLGFIFCDLHATLQQVRETIADQLKEIRSLQGEYQFLDRNSWLVTRTQEAKMVLCDVYADDRICVNVIHSPAENRVCHASGGSRISEIVETPSVTFTLPPLSQHHSDVTDSAHVQVRHPLPKKSTRSTIKNLLIGDKSSSEMRSKLGLVAKPILLSYVRAEAASHAIYLKEELKKQGFSVYLDVDEIRTGNDWQDALNYAVSNCTVFVPLITPQYGMTQWTNREVKLADVLNKFIIPVNFLERWPPECLAIQFASTQYVCWKPPDPEDKDQHDYRVWNHEYIAQVAEEICKRFKLMFNNKESMLQTLRHTVKVKEPRFRKEAKSVYAVDNAGFGTCESIPEEGTEEGQNQFVVISAHPKDMMFACEAKRLLTKEGFTVWSSTELLDETEGGDVFLASIPEDGTVPKINTVSKTPLTRVDTEVISEKQALCRLSSQMSSIGVMTESLSPETIERLTTFQKKVDQAGVVIILVSKAYTESKTSLQQIFYCEHRKKVVLVKMDDHPVRSIYTMLMGNDMLKAINNPQIHCNIVSKVKRSFHNQSTLTTKDETAEAKMQYLVNFMKKNLPVFNRCVYIAGSTKLQHKRSEEICSAIGRALANRKDINVVTGGFFGVGDIIARAFEDTKRMLMPNNYEEAPVYHILPSTDSEDFSQKANQSEDGSFETISYGKSFFLGDSVKERESAVARLFDICIVVEGGPGAAHEVEQFIWNDHFVIPVISTGGAASGQFGVPLKILEPPPSVSKEDWSVLSEKDASPEQVAQAVSNIVQSLNVALAEHAKKEAAKPQPARKVRRRSRKSRKKHRESTLKTVCEEVDSLKDSSTIESIDKNDVDDSDVICSAPPGWAKFVKLFKRHHAVSS